MLASNIIYAVERELIAVDWAIYDLITEGKEKDQINFKSTAGHQEPPIARPFLPNVRSTPTSEAV
jgi:hypothetical protein